MHYMIENLKDTGEEIQTHATTEMNLEDIMLSAIAETKTII